MTIATGIPRFDCHIPLYRLKMHTSDNFLDIQNGGLNPFTRSNLREMCSFHSFSSRECLTRSCFVYIRLPLWRHRACIATYTLRKAVSTWSWRYRFKCGQFCFKNTWFDSYDLNERGRKEIDHDSTSGVAARGATGDPTRAWWRVQP